MTELIGQTIGGCEIVELLGAGGMGAAYRARQTVLDRFVALKIIAPQVAKDPNTSPASSMRPRPLRSSITPTSSPSTRRAATRVCTISFKSWSKANRSTAASIARERWTRRRRWRCASLSPRG